jgi:hypothetical protein
MQNGRKTPRHFRLRPPWPKCRPRQIERFRERVMRAYVTDTREIVLRASALSKRLPRALKSLRFCSSESPSL